MELKDVIYKRQSTRKFKDLDVNKEDLIKILDSARVAPSGKNVQNWHFVVIKDKNLKQKIGKVIVDKNETIARKVDAKDSAKGLSFRNLVKNFTLFGMEAPVLIAVYATAYDPTGYHEYLLSECSQEDIDKLFIRNPGMQNIGAAVENMVLTAVDLGYGSCWMTGQNYAADEIEEVIEKEAGFKKEGFFLACMLAVGVPAAGGKSPRKKDLDDICTFI